MIIQNDSIGGHINIITGKYAKFFLFFAPPPLPSYCYMYFGTELWFVLISWRFILDRVIVMRMFVRLHQTNDHAKNTRRAR
jgi:hypothetical protein